MAKQTNELQANRTTLVVSTTSEIGKAIKTFNALTAYAYTDEQFLLWERLIMKARPHTTPKEIGNVVMKLASGIEIQADPKLGVQNILKHLFTKQEIQDAENRRLEEEIANIEN
jgi:hypothetical protein